jgi:Transposase DDE domain
MPSIPQIAVAMQTLLIDIAHEAACDSGFQRRQRQMSGAQFVQTVVFGWMAHPDARIEQLVGVAADLGVSITPQALCERFSAEAAACLQRVLAAMVRFTLSSDPAVLPLLDRFAAVEIQDSTTISLPDALADHYQGCGGRAGRVAAACKAQFRWELRSGRLEGPILQHGRASDRAVSFRERSRVGTLRIRDLGYWQLDDLAHDAADGRFWLMRFKPNTALFGADGARQELVDLLSTHAPEIGAQLDLPIQLGVRQRIACRLIARKVDAQLAAARLAQAERTAKRKGRHLSALTRMLCAWEVIVTNGVCSMLTAAEAWILLRARWQIELLFKLWKQHGHLDTSKGRQPYRVLCELYAKFIGLMLQHWLLLAGSWAAPDRSLVRGARVVRAWAERLARALACPTRLSQILTDTVAAIARATRQTRRTKAPNLWQLLGGKPALGLT